MATWPATLQIGQPVVVTAELAKAGAEDVSGSYSWELVLMDGSGVVVADMPKATLDLLMVSVPVGDTVDVQARANSLFPCRAGALQIGEQYTAVYLARIDTVVGAAVSESGLLTISS